MSGPEAPGRGEVPPAARGLLPALGPVLGGLRGGGKQLPRPTAASWLPLEDDTEAPRGPVPASQLGQVPVAGLGLPQPPCVGESPPRLFWALGVGTHLVIGAEAVHLLLEHGRPHVFA